MCACLRVHAHTEECKLVCQYLVNACYGHDQDKISGLVCKGGVLKGATINCVMHWGVNWECNLWAEACRINYTLSERESGTGHVESWFFRRIIIGGKCQLCLETGLNRWLRRAGLRSWNHGHYLSGSCIRLNRKQCSNWIGSWWERKKSGKEIWRLPWWSR